ncbi:MAG: hypothetical protein NTW21_28315 [Verrucomicrobia bacterium]|nr:hypothetical protein [Verrucomicrobiota bacterium]
MKPRRPLNHWIFVAFGLPCTAFAADSYWNGATGNWTSANWNPSEPTLNEDAIINGGTAQITDGNSEYADDLFLGQTSGQSGHISMGGGYLLVEHDQYIGYGGVGTLTQNGGENRCSYGLSNYDLHLGYAAGSSGTYTMTGGTLYTGDQYIGRLGTGSFIQSGGTNNVSATGSGVADHMYIGWANSSGYGSGTYRLSGTGLLVLNHKNSNIYVGGEYSSTFPPGRFEWFREGGISWTDPSGNGGMVMGANGTLAMGYSFNSIPTMVSGLQNATLEVTNGATVTKVNDGIVSSVNYLRFGSATGAGYGTQTGGTVQVGQAAYIGDGGTGVATQTGGNFNTTTHLYLGLNGAQGTYRLKGGTLSVGSNIFGGTGTGTLVLDGGTLSLSGTIFNVTNLVVGDEQAGSWTLGAGKTLTVASHVVGKNYNGSFTQSGGINNAGTLTLGQTSGSGTYLLTGGSLNVSGQVLDGTGTGTLQIDGGTFAPSGSVTVDNLKVGITAAGSHTQAAGSYSISTLTLGNGTYRLAGGSLAAGGVSNTAGTGTLNLDGGTFSPSGTVTVDNLGVGIASAGSHGQTGQTYSVGTLTLGNGTYTLTGGSLAVSGEVLNGTGTGTLQIDGGTFTSAGGVAMDHLKVGIAAAGSHTQTTGSYSIGTLTLGSGTYRLAGGTLAAGGVSNTTGAGTLNLDGGTFSPSGAVAADNLGLGIASAGSHSQTGQNYSIGILTLGNGTYTLSGGTLAVSGDVINSTGTSTLVLDGGSFLPNANVNVDAWKIGQNATASFHQTSRIYAVAGDLSLGVNAGGDGTYQLSSGATLTVGGALVNGAGTGTLILNGGTFNPVGAVDVDNLKLADTIDVSFTQTSNSYTAASLLLGMNVGRSGTWRLDGGTLNVAAIPDSPGTSSLILNGGTMAASGDLWIDHLTVGLTRSASHVQTGSSVTVSNNLSLGYDSTYTLAGGSLNVAAAIKGGGGGSTQLTLNGGTLSAGGEVSVMHVVVGDDKSGSHTQSANTWSVGGTMTLGQNPGGYGSYVLSGGQLQVKGALTIGAGGTGRFDWQTGTLGVGEMNFGTNSTLALGFGVAMENLADGSLYGGSQAPGNLERAVLELSRGSSTQRTADLTLRELKLAVGIGAADYSMKGGALTVNRLEVGSMGMASGAFTQTNGTVVVAASLVVGNMPGTGGTYQLQGGMLGGTGGLSLRPFGGPGEATFTGNGTVALTGPLVNNGRVVADGLGSSRSLDLSAAAGVLNSFENQVGERHGWGAENGGRLILPAIPVIPAGLFYNWGESPSGNGEFSLDLVNSAQLTFHGLTASGSLTGSLLATDNASVPALPGGYQIIGVWNFDLSTTFAATRLMFRYDDTLARMMGIGDENQLEVLHYVNGQWQVVTGLRDVTNKWIGTTDLTSLSPFAVGAIPEPRSLMLLALGSLALLRRTNHSKLQE